MAHLAERLNPSQILIEFLRSQSSGVERVVEVSRETLRRIDPISIPNFPPLGIRLKLGASDALWTPSDFGTISSQKVPLQIHAVPLFPSRISSLPWSLPEDNGSHENCEQVPSASTSLLLGSEAQEDHSTWLENNHADNNQRMLLERLKQFVEKEEIPCDARDGLGGILTWWKLNKSKLNQDKSRQFNLMVLGFLRGELGLSTTSGTHQKLSSGLIVPLPNNQAQGKPPDLEPRIYTSKELAEQLRYDEATIRRKAADSWKEGTEPQSLKGHLDWYVVGRGSSGGGRRCGWMFQRLKRADAS